MRKTLQITIALVIAIGSLLYLLPLAIAVARGRTNTFAIGVLNLFLGWTLVGWVAALAWAVAHDQYQLA